MKAALVVAAVSCAARVQAFVPTHSTSIKHTAGPSQHVRGDASCQAERRRFEGSRRRRYSGAVCMSTDLDTSAEYVKAELARVQEEYEAKRKAKIMEQTKQAAARGEAAVTPLADLELLPYINEETGMITTVDTKGAKASAYAIYDESKTLQYIGVSRGVQQSLRLHLGRCPAETYYFKVQHIARPSRSLLEIVKDAWIKENGSVPKGNDEGEMQAMWENPLNTVLLYTDEDKEYIAEKREKGKEVNGIKDVARRFESVKIEVLEKRGIKESLRFDHKIKAKGLLDLHIDKPKPDTAVPK